MYTSKKSETKKHVQDIFYATDMDGNDTIELFEFQLICRYIEHDTITQQEAETLFIEEADLLNPINGERAMSLDKFVQISMEKALFSYKKCNKFSQDIPPEDETISGLNSLKKFWQQRSKLIKYRFLKAKQYTENIKQFVEQLQTHLQKDKIEKPKALWLSYRILDEESRRVVLEHESNLILNQILPVKLHMIRIVANKFEQLI